MRQISTIRFVAFPVFLTAFGVLAQTHLKETWIDKTVVAAAGLGLATVAIIFEMIFSRNLICWWRVIEKHIVAAPWDALVAHRTSWTLWLARAALFLPYAAFAAYWVYQLSGYASLAVAVAAAAALIAVWVWWNPQIVQPRSAP
jgi:hypothetical protein